MRYQTVRGLLPRFTLKGCDRLTLRGCSAEAQYNTQMYGRRPYGVGFLVAGYDVRFLLPRNELSW